MTRRLQITVDLDSPVTDLFDSPDDQPRTVARNLLTDPETIEVRAGVTVLGARWLGTGWADAPGGTDVDLEHARTAIGLLRKLIDGAIFDPAFGPSYGPDPGVVITPDRLAIVYDAFMHAIDVKLTSDEYALLESLKAAT